MVLCGKELAGYICDPNDPTTATSVVFIMTVLLCAN